MPEKWNLNGFYDASKLTPLFEAIPFRLSCRTFAGAPTAQQWNTLRLAADTLALPGVRIAMGICDTSMFQPFGGGVARFKNVQRYAAIIAPDDNPAARICAGISGEMLLLSAVADGLGGAWASGAYNRGNVRISLANNEKIIALLPLGVPKVLPTPRVSLKRKAHSLIYPPVFENAPIVFREAARAVNAAPSAINRQPWLLTYEPEKGMSISVKRPASRFNLGIALCHALLALGRTPTICTLSPDALAVRITLS